MSTHCRLASRLVLALAVLYVPAFCAAKRPPNVVIISFDTLRADHVGAYGYDRRTTPNVDALAAESVLFTNAFAPTPFSLPSHATLFTSVYPGTHRTFSRNDTLPERFRTLASILKERGYSTGAFTGGFDIHSVFGLSRGFDVYFDEIDRGSFSDSVPRALDWLDAHKDGPFFLFVHGYDGHPPYRTPMEWQHKFDPGYRGPLDGMGIDHKLTDRIEGTSLFTDYRWTKLDRTLTQADLDHLVAHYDGAIAFADWNVGRLLDRIKALHLSDETIVIVLGGHGELILNHHDALTSPYGEFFDASLRVPLIVKAPGLAPRRVEHPAGLVDVLPTVLELAGIPSEPQAQGRSLVPALQGRGEDRPVFMQTYPATRPELCTGIRRGQWELIRCPSLEDALFGLDYDPRLLMNAQREAPQLYHDLSLELGAWLDRQPKAPETAAPTPSEQSAIRDRLRQEAFRAGYFEQQTEQQAAVRERLKKETYWWIDKPDAARLWEIHRRQQADAAGLPKWRRFQGDMGRVLAELFNGRIPRDFLEFFSRDPERNVPDEKGIVVAPADGIVLQIRESPAGKTVVISLGFMDVHVQRIPLSGKIFSMRTEGHGHLSTDDPAHFGNSQVVTQFDTEIGTVEIRQITGLHTRRIDNYVKVGDKVRLGQRMGRILLGSTVLLTLPPKVTLAVKPYDRVYGGETVLGRY